MDKHCISRNETLTLLHHLACVFQLVIVFIIHLQTYKLFSPLLLWYDVCVIKSMMNVT